MRIIASILVATRFAQITAAVFALLILSGAASAKPFLNINAELVGCDRLRVGGQCSIMVSVSGQWQGSNSGTKETGFGNPKMISVISSHSEEVRAGFPPEHGDIKSIEVLRPGNNRRFLVYGVKAGRARIELTSRSDEYDVRTNRISLTVKPDHSEAGASAATGGSSSKDRIIVSDVRLADGKTTIDVEIEHSGPFSNRLQSRGIDARWVSGAGTSTGVWLGYVQPSAGGYDKLGNAHLFRNTITLPSIDGGMHSIYYRKASASFFVEPPPPVPIAEVDLGAKADMMAGLFGDPAGEREEEASANYTRAIPAIIKVEKGGEAAYDLTSVPYSAPVGSRDANIIWRNGAQQYHPLLSAEMKRGLSATAAVISAPGSGGGKILRIKVSATSEAVVSADAQNPERLLFLSRVLPGNHNVSIRVAVEPPSAVDGVISVSPTEVGADGMSYVLVKLDTAPLGTVVINVNPTGVAADKTSLTFNDLNFDVAQWVSVTPRPAQAEGEASIASGAAAGIVVSSATDSYKAKPAEVRVRTAGGEGGGVKEIPTCSGPDDTRECVFASQIASSRIMPGFGADDGVYTNDGALVGAFGTKDRPTDLVFRCLAPEGKECTSPAALPPDMFGIYCDNHLDLLPEDKTSVPSGESVEFTHSTRPAGVYGFALGCSAISSHPFTLQAITYRNRVSP